MQLFDKNNMFLIYKTAQHIKFRHSMSTTFTWMVWLVWFPPFNEVIVISSGGIRDHLVSQVTEGLLPCQNSWWLWSLFFIVVDLVLDVWLLVALYQKEDNVLFLLHASLFTLHQQLLQVGGNVWVCQKKDNSILFFESLYYIERDALTFYCGVRLI